MTSALSEVPSELQLERILYLCEKAYRPVVWNLPDDFDSYGNFLRVIPRLDMTSSPGYPYCVEKPTNGEFLGWNGVECDAFALSRLWLDVQSVFSDRYDQILKVFIKQEPHKKSKIEEKRWRLIMAASLPVQVVWHMMFDIQNDLEISKPLDIPSQQGIVAVHGGWKIFRQYWISKGYDVGLDKSAWDWTAPYWALQLDLQLRYRLCRGSQKARWLTIAQTLWDHMFAKPKLLLSDGSLYQQKVPGIMKSGCVNTISTNSHMQVFVHILACDSAGVSVYPLPVCCGDDTLQCSFQASDLSHYSRWGVVVKSASQGLEFLGHEFVAQGPAPLYLPKHMSAFCHTNYPLDYLDQMARLYCHTRMFYFWERIAQSLGTPLPMSREAYVYWYDVPED